MKNKLAHRIYSDAEMNAFVRGQGVIAPWRKDREELIRRASSAYRDGRFTEADYEAFLTQLDARSNRHIDADDRDKAKSGRVGHDRTFGDQSDHKTRKIGPYVQGLIVPLQKPMEAERGCALVLAPRRRVRGPARHDADQRQQRRLRTREQADKRKMPAELSRHYTRAQLAAISVIVWRAGNAAKQGLPCILAIGSVAESASVSPRIVRNAIAIGRRAGHIEVSYQKRGPSEFRILDPRIRERIEDNRYGSYPLIPRRKNSSTDTSIKSPREAANFCLDASWIEPLGKIAKLGLSDYHVPKVARHVPVPEIVPEPPNQDEGDEARREAITEAAAVMTYDEVSAEPPSALESAITSWKAVIQSWEAHQKEGAK